MTDVKPSVFLRQPPEIRNWIYEFVFPCGGSAYNPVLHYRRIQPCSCFRQPLMLVSKQVRAESTSLHYSAHEFHFVLYPPYKNILLAWLDNVAQDSISYIKRFQIKRYVAGTIHYLGERIMAVTVDLNEESTVDVRVAGEVVPVSKEIGEAVKALPHADGRQHLTKDTLMAMFELIGWH